MQRYGCIPCYLLYARIVSDVAVSIVCCRIKGPNRRYDPHRVLLSYLIMAIWAADGGILNYIGILQIYRCIIGGTAGLASFNSLSGEIIRVSLMAASFMALVPIIAILLYA